MGQYCGHGTSPDGTRVKFTEAEAKEIWEAAERATAREVELMPDTGSVLSMASSVRNRLHKLGWSEGIYCPKDGTEFAVITNGCSAILSGSFHGEWPSGDVFVLDETYDPRQIWWKALDKLTDDERAKLEKDTLFNIECIDGHMARFAKFSESVG